MAGLSDWQSLPHAGTVRPSETAQPRTGGWRTGVRPAVDLGLCVNCLLCWIYCPDSAIRLHGTVFDGFDLDHCKGCELCAEVCPTNAIEMVDDVD